MVATLEDDGQAEKLTFAWWNTSLAPSGKSRNDDELRRCAVFVIDYLVSNLGVDFLALAEMSSSDLAYLRDIPNFSHMSFLSGISQVGKSTFDLCYMVNPRKFLLFGTQDVVSVKGTSTLKIGQKLTLTNVESKSVFNVFCSHWPSRLWCEEHHADRHLLGVRLRDEVDQILSKSVSPPYVILLGDYNDEPFAASLSDQLMATRDIDLVRKRDHLLYNPFWGKLGQGGSGQKCGGSYFYKGGKTTRWLTFDQIIYSHAFIGQDNWRLSDEGSHVCDVPGMFDLICDQKSRFDHVPVYGIIERFVKNG